MFTLFAFVYHSKQKDNEDDIPKLSRLPFETPTVDGRNPAPPGMYETLEIMDYLSTVAGFLPSTVPTGTTEVFCMFGLMQLAAELDNPFRDSGFGFDKVDELLLGGTVVV